ncbi:MAG: HD domain-containing protein [Anaerolineales bacterium]|nr:HD domain-containing protein [Anaerolineales bacterium]
MEVKAENPASLLQGEDLSPLVQAYFELCQLKQLYRQGWLRRGVPRQRCESVAEHSFGVALLALWLAEAYYPELDGGKLLRMALLHDFGEIYAGDIIPGDGVPPQDKSRREAESVAQVLGKLPGGEAYVALWEEFERGDTPEARFVRQVDRLEMGLQARVYQAQGFERMQEFLASARQALTEQALLEILAAVEASQQGES